MDNKQIDKLMGKLKSNKLVSWIEGLSFKKILLLWVGIVLFFGGVYYFLKTNGSFLSYGLGGNSVSSIKDMIYFSFITATTTGFGDIVPYGVFKFVAVIEVISGLMLLAIVTSKLVSIKQDIILSEVYDISLNEKINRLRSSFFLFRQNLDRIITKIEEASIRKRELNNVYIYFSSFQDSLIEVNALIKRAGVSRFIKNIDAMNTELIFSTIISSFEKIHEFLLTTQEKKMEWKTETNIRLLKVCLEINDRLFDNLEKMNGVVKETAVDLKVRKESIINAINILLDEKKAE